MTLTRSQTARGALLLAASLTAVTPALAQNAALDAAAFNVSTAPLQAALAGGATPLQIQASALDASWRRFRPNASLATDVSALLNAQTRNSETGPFQFVTRGETLSAGGETFLIAYRGQINLARMDDATRLSLQNSGQKMEAADGYARFLATQTLRLCLLGVRQIGDLSDIRAFDPAADVIQVEVLSAAKVEALTAQAANERSVSNLKQVALGLVQYTQDWDDQLPPMRSAQSMAQIKADSQLPYEAGGLATVQRVLFPYIKSVEIFVHPTTREIYRPNLNLSGRPLGFLEAGEKIVTFYEASPAADGTRAVLYLDGHVKRERETDWAAIRAASDAIAPPLNFKSHPPVGYYDSVPDKNPLPLTAASYTPKIKTALGATVALRGSSINVDTLGSQDTIFLRGTVPSAAQRTLALAVARKNSGGFNVVDQLTIGHR